MTLLRAAVVAGIVAVLGIELVSAFALLSVPVGAILAVVASGVFIAVAAPSLPTVKGVGFGVEQVIVGAVAVVTLVISLVAAPNTWDSMTYHLARVDQWLLRGSVDHYPTSIDRQIWQPPFAEYLLLLARSAAAGGDRLASLVQWLASLGCALAAARIAELLGLSRRSVWLAAVLVVTAPTVVLQATSTQNDLVGAFWIATMAAFALEGLGRPGERATWLWVGASLGLAIGTKGTALVFGLPWMVGLVVGARGRGLRNWLGGLAVAAAVAVVINLPWMLRNIDTYDNPFGDAVVQRLLRPASVSPPVFASNLVANASVHWALPGEPARRVAEAVLKAGNRTLGIDPAILYPYFGGLRVEPWSTDEDLAGNPLLFLVGGVAVLGAVGRWRRLDRAERTAVLAVLGGVILFGLLVRWQPYNGRLQMPGFVLLVPVIAAAAQRLGAGSARALAIVAAVVALPPLVANTIRPMVGPGFQPTRGAVPVGSIFATSRAEQYFARQPGEYQAYRRAVEGVVELRCETVALKAGYDSWEYPLWALARGAGARLRFRHAQVDNRTGRLETGLADPPCALIAIDQREDWAPGGTFTGWTAVERTGRLSLWWPGRPPS